MEKVYIVKVTGAFGIVRYLGFTDSAEMVNFMAEVEATGRGESRSFFVSVDNKEEQKDAINTIIDA